MVLVGSRKFISGGVPGIGTLVPWPSDASLFDAFGSAWRYTGLGSASAAPPSLALMGALGTVLFGAVGLARTLVVVAAMPLGAFGAYRFARRLVGLRGPALAAGVAYGVNPVARNAIATGRFGPLVLFVLLPFVLGRIVRLARLDADVTAGEPAPDPKPRGRFLRLAMLVALAAAWYPVAPALFVVAAAAFVLAAPFAGGWGRVPRGRDRDRRRARCSRAPRSVAARVRRSAFRRGVARFRVPTRPRALRAPALRLRALGRGVDDVGTPRRAPPYRCSSRPALGSAWATRGWLLAVVGWAIVWVPEQVCPERSVLAPEAGLTVAAFGLAIALGIGASVLVDGIRSFRFGWRQPAAIVGGVALLLPMLGFTADTLDGRWHAPRTDWVDTLAFTDSLAAKGQFRMLWLGDPSVLPLDPVVLPDGTGYTLTRNGPGDSTELLRAPQDDADRAVVDRAIELARDGRTNRLGRLLAPTGVRYVVLPTTQGPGGGSARAPLPGWRRALDGQLDLARLETGSGLVLYENLAWIPLRARRSRAGRRPGAGRAARSDARRSRRRPLLRRAAADRRSRRAGRGAVGRGVRHRLGSNRVRPPENAPTLPRVRMGERVPDHERELGRARVHRPVATLGAARWGAGDLALRPVALVAHARSSGATRLGIDQ